MVACTGWEPDWDPSLCMGTGSQKCTEEPCIPQECGSSPSSSGKKLEWSSDLKVGEGRELQP